MEVIKVPSLKIDNLNMQKLLRGLIIPLASKLFKLFKILKLAIQKHHLVKNSDRLYYLNRFSVNFLIKNKKL
ncbi:hypothetical protein Glove_134g94 [Diversispora epigaea]|uniref:Uncharacterized protein n=1 Tax=Diversispora epigaea TaxID=1348612 RepID=A0A397J1Q9_9GLOM|nr:hypothetical protein Glove_134g94 [Diversispora epigaea]